MARRSLSIAAAVAGVRTKVAGKQDRESGLLGSIVNLTLERADGGATVADGNPWHSPAVQAIRLLRVICAAGQGLARICSTRGLLGIAKRPILDWIAGTANSQVLCAASEAMALWQLCIGYGMDISMWADLERTMRERAAADSEKGGYHAIAAIMSIKVAGAVVEASVRELESSRKRQVAREGRAARGRLDSDSDDADDEDTEEGKL